MDNKLNFITDIELNNCVIKFKSYPENYDNELSGRKANTVREIDPNDYRFILLQEMHKRKVYGIIEIERNPQTPEQKNFGRAISDITYYKNFVIVSWMVYTPNYHLGFKEGFVLALKEVQANCKYQEEKTEESYKHYIQEEVDEDEERRVSRLQGDKIPDKT